MPAIPGRVLAAVALILSLMQLPAAAAEITSRQLTLLTNNCMQCHARPETGAPLMGRADDWRERVARGEDTMLVNVVEGIRGMPPLGYCSACSETDFRQMIRLMAAMPNNDGEGK